MKRFLIFLRSVASDWKGSMSGGLGIFFTVLCFYFDSTWQKFLFGIMAIIGIGLAFFRSWERLYVKTANPIHLEVDFNRSQVLIHDRKTFPDTLHPSGRVFQVLESIKIDSQIRFINSSNNTILITGIDATLRRKRKFRKSQQTGTWNVAVGNLLEITQGNGLSIPGPSKSDYQFLRWAIGITANPREAFADSDYVLVLTVHALGLQDYDIEFDLDWQNDDWAKLQARQ